MRDNIEVYIFDNETLTLTDVFKTSYYALSLDEETNATSIIKIKCEKQIKKKDYLLIKGLPEDLYFIIDEVVKDKNESIYTINCKDILNLFNRKILLTNTEWLDNSIEYFIANTINVNFISSNDAFQNLSFIELEYNSETKENVEFDENNYIYNLYDFLTSVRKNNQIALKFKIESGYLKIKIGKINTQEVIIDATVADVIDYKKSYEINVISKVAVYCEEDSSVTEFYLLNNGTVTTDKDEEKRVFGDTTTEYCSTIEDIEKTANDIFNSNKYNHLIEFKVKNDSKLVDVTSLSIGTRVMIKTDEVIESYISSINIDSTTNFTQFKCGTVRLNFLGKIKKENKQVSSINDIKRNITFSNKKLDNLLNFEKMINAILDGISTHFEHGRNTPTQSYITTPWFQIASGKNAFEVSGNSNITERITFNKPFGGLPPHIVPQLANSTTNTAYCQVVVKAINQTTEYFDMQIINDASSGVLPGVAWIAVGQPATTNAQTLSEEEVPS